MTERFRERAVVLGKEALQPKEIPSITVWGNNLPEVWEDSVLATLEWGTTIPTQYDNPEIDPESRDATMMITLAQPLAEPRIHKGFPCGFDDLYVYGEEVVNGVHDHWVREGGWSYSYHDRLVNWPGRDVEMPFSVDQIMAMSKLLAETPHTRRAHAITWNPLKDAGHHEPPCLQRVWGRVVHSEGDQYLLEMNTHWRSRDAFKGAFMNIYALTLLQKRMAEMISEYSGKNVGVGRYVDITDSYHIYGSYIRRGEMDRFTDSLKKMDFERRTASTADFVVAFDMDRGKERLAEEKAQGKQ